MTYRQHMLRELLGQPILSYTPKEERTKPMPVVVALHCNHDDLHNQIKAQQRTILQLQCKRDDLKLALIFLPILVGCATFMAGLVIGHL